MFLTWSGSAHGSVGPRVFPVANLRLNIADFLLVLFRRRIELENDVTADGVVDVVDEGDGQQEHDEDPAVVDDHVLDDRVPVPAVGKGLELHRHF